MAEQDVDPIVETDACDVFKFGHCDRCDIPCEEYWELEFDEDEDDDE